MGFYEYIGSQFSRPRGVIGSICCVIMNVMNRAMYDAAAAGIWPDPSSRILDIGYGNGYLIHRLYNESEASIYGIDISKDALTNAIKRNKSGIARNKIHLSIGDCSSTNYENNFFDAVTTVNTIYFWPDTHQTMAEIYRILKPGGTFSNAFYGKPFLKKSKCTRKGFRLCEPKEIAAMAKQAGFTKITIKAISHQRGFIIQCIK